MKHNVFESNARKSGMVKVRGGFSDIHGINPSNITMQLYEFDNTMRIHLSNGLLGLAQDIYSNRFSYFFPGNYLYEEGIADIFIKDILNDVFCERNTSGNVFELNWHLMMERINEVIMEASYNEVLDIIMYCVNWFESEINLHKGILYTKMNRVFENDYVGYRFIENKIVPITDKQEIKEIERASHIPYEGCRSHLRKAIGFLADRENKDYKNCIKESISAVESACQQIVGDEKATLGEALKKLEDNGVALHPSLKQGFSKLYGYTSDQGGIRHAEGLFESNVTFEEAKYMLVSCSAFVNYLIAVSGKGSN